VISEAPPPKTLKAQHEVVTLTINTGVRPPGGNTPATGPTLPRPGQRTVPTLPRRQ